jgi:hypothetical protein
LTKTSGPVPAPAALGPVDAVLLSHDQHPDNLDRLGRDHLAGVPLVHRLGQGPARGDGAVAAQLAGDRADPPRRLHLLRPGERFGI